MNRFAAIPGNSAKWTFPEATPNSLTLKVTVFAVAKFAVLTLRETRSSECPADCMVAVDISYSRGNQLDCLATLYSCHNRFTQSSRQVGEGVCSEVPPGGQDQQAQSVPKDQQNFPAVQVHLGRVPDPSWEILLV